MEYVREQFSKIPGARFTEGELFRTPLDAATLNRVRKVNFGVPDLSTFAMLGRNPANPAPPGGHIGFSPIIPRTGEAVLEYSRFYTENLAEVSEGGTLRFVGPIFMTNWERSMVAMIMFPIGRDKVHEREDARCVQQVGGTGCGARLGGVPCAGRLPGRMCEDLLVQQPCADAPARDDQGCGGSQRHPLAGSLWRVAEAPEEGMMKRVAIWICSSRCARAGRAGCRSRWAAPVAAASGEAVYQRWCVHCHAAGRGNPGTESLQVKYGGKVPAVLLERTDLAPRGRVACSCARACCRWHAFRKTEITDAELAALSAYVAKGYTGR